MTKFIYIFVVSTFFQVHAIELGKLESNARETVPKIAYEQSVWFFYKPNCPICYGQVKELRCLGDKTKLISVGFNGKRAELWRESKKLQISKLPLFRSYRVNKLDIKKIPIKKDLSPQMILFHKQKIIKLFIGLTTCEMIKDEFIKHKVTL